MSNSKGAGRKQSACVTTCIEDKYGNLIMEQDKILAKWHEYISELYDDNRGEILQVHNESELTPVTRREVDCALKGMLMNKAPGPDNIFTEMLVTSGEAGLTELTSLTNMMYQEGCFSENMNNSIFITLPKICGIAKCEKHRTISLMSHITKLVLNVLVNRHRARSLMEISQLQYGFMPDRRTRNAIFVLRRLVERSIKKQKDVFTCFIDYSKALDTVKHASLFDLLLSLNIKSHDIKLLANLYWNQQAAVRHNEEVSGSMNIKQGIRQGCVASPHLFALYTEMIMRNIEGNEGFRVVGTVINNLRYADDKVIIAETEEELQQLINTVVRVSENKGLNLNGSKSFTMVFQGLHSHTYM